MPNSLRSSRRVIVLGVVISLAFLGFSPPRPVSKAQEPAKATDKKTLREQIIALHVAIDLMEVEQGADRQTLTESIKEERAILARFDLFLQNQKISINDEMSLANDLEAWALAGHWIIALSALDTVDEESLKKSLSVENKEAFKEIADNFGKEVLEELNALGKIEKKEKFSEARKRLAYRMMEQVMKKATERVRQKAAPLRKEFARRSAELVGKKLDLETLERQYRGAR